MYYIVRAGWLLGGGKEDRKFVGRIIQQARTRSELMVANDKFGSPTYTRDLSSGIMQLVETGQYGTYHMVNTGPASSEYEIAQKILEYTRIGNCRLIPARQPISHWLHHTRGWRRGTTTVCNCWAWSSCARGRMPSRSTLRPPGMLSTRVRQMSGAGSALANSCAMDKTVQPSRDSAPGPERVLAHGP